MTILVSAARRLFGFVLFPQKHAARYKFPPPLNRPSERPSAVQAGAMAHWCALLQGGHVAVAQWWALLQRWYMGGSRHSWAWAAAMASACTPPSRPPRAPPPCGAPHQNSLALVLISNCALKFPFLILSSRGSTTFSFQLFFTELSSWQYDSSKNTFHIAGQRPGASSRKSGIKCFLYLEAGMTKVKRNQNTRMACWRSSPPRSQHTAWRTERCGCRGHGGSHARRHTEPNHTRTLCVLRLPLVTIFTECFFSYPVMVQHNYPQDMILSFDYQKLLQHRSNKAKAALRTVRAPAHMPLPLAAQPS